MTQTLTPPQSDIERRWATEVPVGQTFDLSNSYMGWTMTTAPSGLFTVFQQDKQTRFEIQGAFSPRHGIKFIAAYVAGRADGCRSGIESVTNDIRKVLAL